MQNKAINVNRADAESCIDLDIGVQRSGVGAFQARDGDMWGKPPCFACYAHSHQGGVDFGLQMVELVAGCHTHPQDARLHAFAEIAHA